MEYDHLLARKALKFVLEKFINKIDLAGEPYTDHLYRVATNQEYVFTDSEKRYQFRAVGYLHDTLEDIDNVSVADLLERFPEDVVNAVVILTKKKGQNYEEYIEEIGKTELTTRVKLADLTDNMDIRRLPVFGEREIKRLQKYHKAFVYLSEKLKLFQN
jgi:(p)ppGpp synthase/HD superfamily hydrolase